MRAAAAALAVLLTLVLAPIAAAAECPKTTLGDVEDEVMCVVCGTPLGLATEAPQAERERALIRREIDRCRSKEEIKQTLASEFGDEVLATPNRDGFGLAAWLVPILASIAGAITIALAALGWRRHRRTAAADHAEAVSPSASSRLQADLDRYEL